MADTLKWMDPRAVADLIRNDHPQIIAIVLLYLFEGATRVFEPAPAAALASIELALALVFFVGAIVYLRPMKRAARARLAARGRSAAP